MHPSNPQSSQQHARSRLQTRVPVSVGICACCWAFATVLIVSKQAMPGRARGIRMNDLDRPSSCMAWLDHAWARCVPHARCLNGQRVPESAAQNLWLNAANCKPWTWRAWTFANAQLQKAFKRRAVCSCPSCSKCIPYEGR